MLSTRRTPRVSQTRRKKLIKSIRENNFEDVRYYCIDGNIDHVIHHPERQTRYVSFRDSGVKTFHAYDQNLLGICLNMTLGAETKEKRLKNYLENHQIFKLIVDKKPSLCWKHHDLLRNVYWTPASFLNIAYLYNHNLMRFINYLMHCMLYGRSAGIEYFINYLENGEKFPSRLAD